MSGLNYSMSAYGWKGYDVKLNIPIRYENLSEEFGGINSKIEYYIRKTGDEIKHASNVKANMTEWRTHQKNIHFMKIT
mgnify:CR=1 FL=1